MKIHDSEIFQVLTQEKSGPIYWRRIDLLHLMYELQENVEKELEDMRFEYDTTLIESKFDKSVLPASSVISDFTQDFNIVFKNMMQNVLAKFPSTKATVESLYENVDSIHYSYQPDRMDPTITTEIECVGNGKFMGDIADTLDVLSLRRFSCEKESTFNGDVITNIELRFTFDGFKNIHTLNDRILPEMARHLVSILNTIHNNFRLANVYKDEPEKDYYCFVAVTEFMHLASMLGFTPAMENKRFWTKNKLARRYRNGFGLFTDETINSLKKALNK